MRFFGDDATSGVAGCSSGTYSGPDAAAAQVVGRCWDRAGNVSAPGTFDLRYDATAPSLARVTASGRDHKVRLEWAVPDAADLDVRRDGRRLLSGGPSGAMVDRRLRNGHRYQYVVSATDAAGNTAKRTLSVVPGPRLLGPRAGVALDHPPLLRWTRIRGADYYNVQVFRGKRKVLSAWPTQPKLRLPRDVAVRRAQAAAEAGTPLPLVRVARRGRAGSERIRAPDRCADVRDHAIESGRMAERKIRVVVAKPGLDGHDRGAKIIARALRDAGMEVIYTGLHQTPEQIVETVLQEDADAVGLSILSGAHMTLVPRVVELLREQDAGDVVVTVGGTIPSQDIPELKELGVAAVFTPGAPTQAIIDFIEGAVTP